MDPSESCSTGISQFASNGILDDTGAYDLISGSKPDCWNHRRRGSFFLTRGQACSLTYASVFASYAFAYLQHRTINL